ncbi:protein STICHEL-like 4 [Impatiens glandulifera]|uniref:protein STICHEL-like 4 n=1 Tax=Impatiens glandulifera TaxID=253017 RepID=UPI001FB0DE8B|nr:protein STICHEL-like 4 [Impatiens glandulifera]
MSKHIGGGDRILKDANGDINNHLRNHIHLTNCIHLKNHMHKQNPILADRSITRDLAFLQRSRSLKDPSTSPPSDLLSKRVEKKESSASGNGRCSRSHQRSSNKGFTVDSKEEDEEYAHPRSRRKGSNDDHCCSVSGKSVHKGRIRGIHGEKEHTVDEGKTASVGIHRGGRRRKFRGTRRSQTMTRVSGLADIQNEMSVASNSFVQEDHNFILTPNNNCGIPWNWSRIHHRGKTFLDKAGKSLSCGLSDSKLRKDISDFPIISDHSSSSANLNAEALPLLVEPYDSQDSVENAARVHDYSGELGIFADNLLMNETDSDLESEARSGLQHKFKRHQNFTQRYTPRLFRDLVGQNLVAQALSNAVSKRKIGLLYVFYGPHGTGKTSCARIFARALNCQSDHSRPCGICKSCMAYDTGKSKNIREIGPVGNFDMEGIVRLLENMASSYRVLIFDDCDSFSSDCWNSLSKVIDRSPRRSVFVFVCSTLDVLPHVISSRCQKFYFPKLKDADIIYILHLISDKEDLNIDEDALKLIASRSDGSLRDAEMTLEQLSLLGQRISVPLVQELVGLISDEKLVDLLDLALSADTINTVKTLREIMQSGVEPLDLMSQLATVITDILAGSYDITKSKRRRKFFKHQTLTKAEMEKLRQALKTLSEAEKQLRVSNDRLTWLTAALLQLAPDQQYMLPSSSAEVSFHHSPHIQNNNAGSKERLSARNSQAGPSEIQQLAFTNSVDMNQDHCRKSSAKKDKEMEEIWLEVLERIQINSIRELLYHEGKIVSLSFSAAPNVKLVFSSPQTKSKAETYKHHMLKAFESVFGSPVTIEIRCEAQRKSKGGQFVKPFSRDVSSLVHTNISPINDEEENDHGLSHRRSSQSKSFGKTSEIEEIARANDDIIQHDERDSRKVVRGAESSYDDNNNKSLPKAKKLEESRCQSIVRSKVSLAHVIQQVEGHRKRNGWLKHKAVTIAERLEQENLKMEARSKSLLCWKAPRRAVTPRKISRLKMRTRRTQTLLRFVSCGKCISKTKAR